MSHGLSKQVLELISKYIDSLEELEILILVKNDPQKSWSLDRVNDQVRSSAASIQQRLAKLVETGFVAFDSSTKEYRYEPKSENLVTAVTLLAEAYRERRIKVIEAIYSKPVSGIRSFSEAFRFKRENNDG